MRSSALCLALIVLSACSEAPNEPLAKSSAPLANPEPQPAALSENMSEGEELVAAHCGACHSLALVEQNRMSRKNWVATIRWMQEKQGLWDLGDAEAPILDYLEQNYGVAEIPWRRKPLEQHLELGSE